RSRVYQWERDYPVDGQSSASCKTEFKLKFLLDRNDREEFYRSLGSSINENLPITIRIGRDNMPAFEVNKPGKGYASLTRKSAQIAAFIGSKAFNQLHTSNPYGARFSSINRGSSFLGAEED